MLFDEKEATPKSITIPDDESAHSDGVDIDLEDISYDPQDKKRVSKAVSNCISDAETTPKKLGLVSKLV